ncbi:MAG: hypothetical protein AAFX56_06135 [Pseudomonadota bacterium]
MKRLYWSALLLVLGPLVHADEAGNDNEAAAETPAAGNLVAQNAEARNEPSPLAAADDAPGQDPDAPKTMSGMSILGNEEAPKSLVIIPWKASEIGADLGLDDSLDERADPVDRDVFLRELEFYEIRSGE